MVVYLLTNSVKINSIQYIMKIKLLAAFAILALSSFIPSGQAAEKGDPKVELKAIVEKVQAKLKEGKKTEADLAENFKEFDDLLAEHKGEKTDDVSQILMMKAMLYIQVLDNPEKGTALITQLQKEYPDTKNGKNADKILDSLKKQAESKKIRAELVEGAKFPDFTEKDLAGKPLSIANYKGKVVLLDFWATWCGPCKAELPNVIKTYEAHHGKGFEIIGISLDDSEDKLTA
jgi:thiol-disulfide isomerase/thioredoxin